MKYLCSSDTLSHSIKLQGRLSKGGTMETSNWTDVSDEKPII